MHVLQSSLLVISKPLFFPTLPLSSAPVSYPILRESGALPVGATQLAKPFCRARPSVPLVLPSARSSRGVVIYRRWRWIMVERNVEMSTG